MKILNLSTVHRWNDPRIYYKIAVSLARDHEVVHAAVDGGDVREIQGIKVSPLGKWESRWDRPRLWIKAYREILNGDYDAVHFHDPELAFLLIPYALLGNKKLVCDIHEHPKAAIGGREWIPKPFRSLTASMFSCLLRSSPFIYDDVILAEERYAALFPKRDNVQVILNHALIPEPDFSLPDRFSAYDPDKKLRLIYVGSIVEDRGGRVLVEMMPHIWKRHPEATLDLVGKIRPDSLKRELTNAAEQSSGRIKLHGFLDFNQAAELMQAAHIGLIPLQPHPNHTVSVVTKFFDYMIYGLPCVTSDFPLWSDFLRETPCGVTADPTNAEVFARAVADLASDKASLLNYSETGYKLVREKYSWKQQEEKLLKIYQ